MINKSGFNDKGLEEGLVFKFSDKSINDIIYQLPIVHIIIIIKPII